MTATARSRRSAICCSTNITSQDSRALLGSERLEAPLEHDSNQIAPFPKASNLNNSLPASVTLLTTVHSGSEPPLRQLVTRELRGMGVKRGQFPGFPPGRHLTVPGFAVADTAGAATQFPAAVLGSSSAERTRTCLRTLMLIESCRFASSDTRRSTRPPPEAARAAAVPRVRSVASSCPSGTRQRAGRLR